MKRDNSSSSSSTTTTTNNNNNNNNKNKSTLLLYAAYCKNGGQNRVRRPFSSFHSANAEMHPFDLVYFKSHGSKPVSKPITS